MSDELKNKMLALIDEIDDNLTKIRLLLSGWADGGEETPPTPPLPDPDPPSPVQAPALTGYLWGPSSSAKGQFYLILPKAFIGNVFSATVNGYKYTYGNKAHKGMPVYYGPAKSQMKAPYTISVITLLGTEYRDVVGQVSTGGTYSQGRTKAKTGIVHWNPDAYDRGWCAFVCSGYERDADLYIINKDGSEDKCDHTKKDKDRLTAEWRNGPGRYTKPCWVVHKRDKLYWYIENPKKWQESSELKGEPPP